MTDHNHTLDAEMDLLETLAIKRARRATTEHAVEATVASIGEFIGSKAPPRLVMTIVSLDLIDMAIRLYRGSCSDPEWEHFQSITAERFREIEERNESTDWLKLDRLRPRSNA